MLVQRVQPGEVAEAGRAGDSTAARRRSTTALAVASDTPAVSYVGAFSLKAGQSTIVGQMAEPTEQLRALARRITDAYLRHMTLSGAILAGSGARGDADRYSDLDLLLYAEEVPPAEAAAAARRELGAGAAVLLAHGPNGFLDQFPLEASSARSA